MPVNINSLVNFDITACFLLGISTVKISALASISEFCRVVYFCAIINSGLLHFNSKKMAKIMDIAYNSYLFVFSQSNDDSIKSFVLDSCSSSLVGNFVHPYQRLSLLFFSL